MLTDQRYFAYLHCVYGASVGFRVIVTEYATGTDLNYGPYSITDSRVMLLVANTIYNLRLSPCFKY